MMKNRDSHKYNYSYYDTLVRFNKTMQQHTITITHIVATGINNTHTGACMNLNRNITKCKTFRCNCYEDT